jgi:hypothetical protein
MIEVVAAFVAAGDGEHTCSQDVVDAVLLREWSAWVSNYARQFRGYSELILNGAATAHHHGRSYGRRRTLQ